MYIDLHCDTLTAFADPLGGEGQVSMDALRAADCYVQCFAAFVDAAKQPLSGRLARFLSYADRFDAMVAASGGALVQVTTPDQAQAAREQGSIGALLTVEEGGVLQGDVDNLRTLYDRGVRMMTLTWNYANELGFPNVDAATPQPRADALHVVQPRGLTPFGYDVVGQMNAMGIIVDVSHLSDGGFWDVLRCTRRPVVASHSNARAVCDVTRNLTDDMIRALAANGGVVGLNLCYDFLTARGEDVTSAAVKQVAHLYRVGGEDVLALGTDFDGIPRIEDWGCARLPCLFDALLDVLPLGVLDKMLVHNFLRVWRAQGETCP